MNFARSLKGRLAIIAAIAIVVTGTVVLIFSFFMARSIIRDQVFKTVEGVVSGARSEIEAALENSSTAAEKLAASALLRGALSAYVSGASDKGALAAEMTRILASEADLPSSTWGVYVILQDGAPIATAGKVPRDPSSEGTADLFSDLKPGGDAQTFILDDNDVIVLTAVPVVLGDPTEIVGAVVVRSPSPAIRSSLQDSAGLGASGRLLLSDFVAGKVSVLSYARPLADGAEAALAPEKGTMERLPLASDLPPVKAARGEKGEGEFSGLGEQKVVASYDFIPQPEWGITASVDSEEAFAPIYRLRNISIIVIVVLVIGGVLLALMIARTVSRPLNELQEGVKAFASGDLTTRVAIHDGLEVTALADEFNNMAQRLNDLYDSLERKVRERTIELSEANERLKQLDQLKSDFVSMASHELRSPMASMKMGVSTVLREMVGPLNDDQKLMLDIAERNIDRLTKLTSELLDLTKIEAGQLDINLSECDVVGIANEVVEAYQPLAADKDVSMSVKASGGPALATCDRDRIYRVIQNLVNNALNFTEGGEVSIEVTPSGDQVEVAVSDNGAGIPAEALETIFEKWSQAHSETVSEKRGTGLGLAICKGIVEAHGGQISVESVEGEGTTFKFVLPVRGPDDREEKDDPDSR